MSEELTPQIEQAIRREVIRQMANVKPSTGAAEYRADEWDWKVERIETFPGPGWVFHCLGGIANDMVVYAVWRINRQEQVQLKMKPNMEIKF